MAAGGPGVPLVGLQGGVMGCQVMKSCRSALIMMRWRGWSFLGLILFR
jgi:hypothetical protein